MLKCPGCNQDRDEWLFAVVSGDPGAPANDGVSKVFCVYCLPEADPTPEAAGLLRSHPELVLAN